MSETDKVVETKEFDWTAFLEMRNLEASPESAFSHVEASLETGVKEGMIVERQLDASENTFWLASIDSVYGPLLKLSWLGDENLQEIWHDLTKEKLYPLGYCQMNKMQLEPPKNVAEMCPLWETLALQYLEDASFDTVSMHFLDDEGITPVERIKAGMGVHVTSLNRSYDAKILANHGGLLHLQEVSDSSNEEFVFYNHPRIAQPKGGTLKKPPSDLIRQAKFPSAFNKHEAVEILVDGQPQLGLLENCTGSKIKIDDEAIINTCPGLQLAPIGTFLSGDRTNEKPAAAKEKFRQMTCAEDLGFEKGQKMMILINKKEFHPCTIITLSSHFITLNIETKTSKGNVNYITSVHNPIVFPISWCQSHGLSFHIMKSYQDQLAKIPTSKPEEEKEPEPTLESSNTSDQQGSWCQPIYFNYKCYSASFLSRARLAGLPKKVGPGPVQLVMREVLNLIIGSSFKSGSVLKRLEAKSEHFAMADFVIEELKGKSRVLNLKAKIAIPTKAHQVDKYLREMCQKLSACPNLVSTVLFEDTCPVDCHSRPKADFKEDDSNPGSNNGKTGNIGDRLPSKRTKVGKKRKHPDALLVENSKVNGTSSEAESEASSSRPSSPCPRKKRSKEWGNILPKSEIRTRGAKLPNFSLHLKIRPSRKDQRAMESSDSYRSSYSAENLLSKSGGKKGRRELPPAFSLRDFPKPPPPIRRLRLDGNPEFWTPQDTAKFLSQTPDCAHLARFVVEDDIDGPAFMLLNYPTVKEYWKLKTSTAISLCRHVESVVLAHRCLAF